MMAYLSVSPAKAGAPEGLREILLTGWRARPWARPSPGRR